MANKNTDVLKKIKAVYFIGIGGIGMSAIALFFKKSGVFTAGYDRTKTIITEKLIKNKIPVHFKDDTRQIPKEVISEDKNNVIIVYTPAVAQSHSELKFFKSKKYTVLKRAEILGIITSQNKVIAVAGTHGKTSVSTVISHIFKTAEKNFNAFLGGISKNYDSNLILSEKPDISEYAVVEADEYDRSFLNLSPYTAIITAVDEDHLDIYKNIEDIKHTFEQFISQTSKNGNLLIKKDVKLSKNIFPENTFTYSLDVKCDYYAENIQINTRKSTFDIITPNGKIENAVLNIPGKLNIENAVAAAAVADIHKIPFDKIKDGLSSWQGVKRRFDYIINTDDLVYIDDYAHHPEELSAFINSVKNIYPDKKTIIVFQPHLYSRTRDFADEFAESLSLCDEIVLTDIYPAREAPLKGVSSKLIFDKINSGKKILIKKEEVLNNLKKEKNTVYMTTGAGDIDVLVNKIKELLLKNE